MEMNGNKIKVSDHNGNEKHLIWLCLNTATKLGQVLDIIENRIIRISNKSTNMTRCDLEVKLRGMTKYKISVNT